MHGESTQALSREQAVQTGTTQTPVTEAAGVCEVLRVRGVTEERTKGSMLGGLSDTVRLS
jgi:hypothetical protein